MANDGRGFAMQKTSKTGRTEWEDIHIKHGNYAPRVAFRAPTEEEYDYITQETGKFLQETAREVTLEKAPVEMLDEWIDDEVDDDDVLRQYREKRLKELKAFAERAKFGSLTDISQTEYLDQVTEASKECFVVVFLFKEGIALCDRMRDIVISLARKFPATKFVRIRADEAVGRQFPESQLPALLIYNKGEPKEQLFTFQPYGGNHCLEEDVEWKLKLLGAVDSELEADPSLHREKKSSLTRNYIARRQDFSDDDDDW